VVDWFDTVLFILFYTLFNIQLLFFCAILPRVIVHFPFSGAFIPLFIFQLLDIAMTLRSLKNGMRNAGGACLEGRGRFYYSGARYMNGQGTRIK